MGYFIDIQGTLIDDVEKKPIDGALEFINSLNSSNTPYILVTNNTKTPSKELYEYLKKIGFAIEFKNYIDPLMVLDEIAPAQKVAAYGDPKFLNLLQQNGYVLDYEKPNAVLIGMKKDFMPQEYAQMIELISSGAKLIGMHATTIYAKDGRKYPGIGAILKMLSYATNCEYEVVGKPSKLFYSKALEKLGLNDFSQIQMISDDLVGDLVGVQKLGAQTTLVLSGKLQDPNPILKGLDPKLHPHKIEKNIGKLN